MAAAPDYRRGTGKAVVGGAVNDESTNNLFYSRNRVDACFRRGPDRQRLQMGRWRGRH